MVVATKVEAPLVSEAIGITKRPYQTDGIDFFWRIKRGMNTDAPGLGKTVQAALAAECPALIVCPTYLVSHWYDWLRVHLPKRKVVKAVGSRQDKIDAMLIPADFLIINKEMLRTHIGEIAVVLKRYKYRTVIIDESHHLRNRSTAATRGAEAISQMVPRMYLLTATPIWKEVDDLFMPGRLLYPDIFTSYNDFVQAFCESESDRFSTKVTGVKPESLAELDKIMSMIRVGRTYDDAKRNLPPIVENYFKVDFEQPTERARYKEAVENYRLLLEDESITMTSYMEVMHTLRNMTGLEKVNPILEIVEDTHTYHEGKYVIFCWYKDLAERLAAKLPDAQLITGDMAPEDRVANSKKQKPIIATISALSEGVDLSWARMVIYAEEHWPPGSQVQSLMRVRRERNITPPNYEGPLSMWDEVMMEIDSRNLNEEPILAYFMAVEDTIDEVIHFKSRQRAHTAKEVLREALGIYL